MRHPTTKTAVCVTVTYVLLGLQGCANFNSIYRKFDVNKGQSVAVDVKQRVVISARRFSSNPKESPAVTVTCAEPSPDALSAFANSASASGQSGDSKVLQAAISASESAAFVGLRTQTIQLLRDGMYRICEGYMSGAISDVEFSGLQRRYQNLMMGLLAIEQLTGAVTPRPASINTNAASGTSGDTQKEQDLENTAEKNRADADANLAKAQQAADDQGTVVKAARQKVSNLKEKSLQQPSPNADKDIEEAQASVEEEVKKKDNLDIELKRQQALDEIAISDMQSAKAALASAKLRVGSATYGDSFRDANTKMSEPTAEKLAYTVEQIVRDVVSDSFIQDACLSFLRPTQATVVSNKPSSFTSAQEQQLKEACVDVIRSSANLFKAKVDEAIKAAQSRQ